VWFFLHNLGNVIQEAVKEAVLQQPRISSQQVRSHWLFLKRWTWAGALGLFLGSWVYSGQILLAALGLLAVYPLLKLWSFLHFRRLQEQISVEFCAFLVALQGLLGAGIAFPQALSELSQNTGAFLGGLLQNSLKSFKRGKPWKTVWNQKRWKNAPGTVWHALQLLEAAHRKGLSLLPLVESLIPLLEKEIDSAQRLKSIERNLLTQSMGCALMPWVLGLVAWHFQPEWIADFFNSFSGKCTLGGVLLFEGLGVWMCKQILRFY